MSNTPETDHLENELGQAARMSHPILWAQSRKLERERDEAIRLLKLCADYTITTYQQEAEKFLKQFEEAK